MPASKSKVELALLLERHGASQRGIFEEAGRGIVMFTMQGRQIRLAIKLPALAEWLKPKDEPRGWWGWDAKRKEAWARQQVEQGSREAWRRLLLVTKAKLELVLDGGGTIESEFLASILLPDGRTIHEALEPQIAASYADGRMPPLLGTGGG